jgi:hypothetical protein
MAGITFTFSSAHALTIGLVLILLGTASLVAGIAFSSTIPALIGLGLVFWGIILTYIQTNEYVERKIFDSTATTLLITLNETLETLEFKGKAIYLPPKYLSDPETTKIYIPRQDTEALPTPDTIQKLAMQPSHRNSEGVLITPPAAKLVKLFETAIGTSFLNTSLLDLQKRLPKALIEDLEVVTDFEIKLFVSKENEQPAKQVYPISGAGARARSERIRVKFITTTFKNTFKQTAQLSAIHANIGCPLTSALASALAKTTGKPVIIESEQISEDGVRTQVDYLILNEETL